MAVGGLAVVAAVGTAALAHADGGYDARDWAPAGIVLTLAVGGLFALGRRPSRSAIAAAGAFAALGAYAVLSTSWGGLPHQAWRFLDQALIASLAVLLGSLLGTGARSRAAVAAGVVAGTALCAADLTLRSLVAEAPETWFHGRTLDGWVGYHNAQASFLAIGLAVAVSGLGSSRAAWRAAAGAAAALLVAGVLLTQSRAGVAAAVVVVPLVVAWARRTELVIRAAPLFAVGGLLVEPLRDVDRALVQGAGLDAALEAYGRWTLAGIAIAAAAALVVVPRRVVRRSLAGAIVAAAVVGLAVGLVVELRSTEPFGGLRETLGQRDPNAAEAGATRLASLSFNGRRDAWRVAWDAGRAEPLHGAGQGTFPLAWTKERDLTELYILQPHSLPLELFAELGIVGVVLFAAALAGLLTGVVRGSDHVYAAGALGALLALVGQAAVDWTWSFPGLVAPALAVAGAATGGRRAAAPPVGAIVAGALLALVPLVLLGGHWLGRRDLDRAASAASADPLAAYAAIDDSRRWNRWDPAPLELRGRTEERTGALEAAADDYARASGLSQRPWLDRYREARAAKTAGDARRRAAACSLARRGNPGERRLREAIC